VIDLEESPHSRAVVLGMLREAGAEAGDDAGDVVG
jgi:hypothetical protein